MAAADGTGHEPRTSRVAAKNLAKVLTSRLEHVNHKE